MSGRYDNKEKLIFDGIGLILLIGLIVSMVMPIHPRISARAPIATEVSNMRQIVLALRTYAADSEDKYPPDLQTLLDEGYIDQPELLESVHTQSGNVEPLIYRAGHLGTDLSRTPLVISPPLQPDGRRVVGFTGGSVAEVKMPNEEIEQILKEKDPAP